MNKRAFSGFCVTVLLCLLTSCGGIMKSKTIAADAMDQFHDRFNAGEYDKIYDTADPDFQSSTTRADFLKFMEAVHRKLGDYKHCDSEGWNTNSFNGVTSVDLRYKTTFAKADGDETFTYRISGTRATLRKYNINSAKLVTD